MALWKQCRRFETGKGTVTLNRKSYDGQTTFSVVIKEEGQKRVTLLFEDRPSAVLAFSKATEGARGHSVSWETVESRILDAQAIIERPTASHPSRRTLPLLLAINRVLEPNKNNVAYANNIAKCLHHLAILPNTPEDASTWVRQCCEELSKGVTKNSFKHRIMMFRKALTVVTLFDKCFVAGLASALEVEKGRISIWCRRCPTKESRHHAPLSKTQVENLLEGRPIEVCFWIIKSLACGLRPNEVNRLQLEHVQTGKIMLRQVITKTRTNKMPPASTVLQAILKLQDWFPRQSKRVDLDGIVPYQFRTTAATHLVYCGVDHNSVAEYLGHSTAEMALRVYSTQRPPGALDLPAQYYGLSGVVVSGVRVAATEPLYHQWLLSLLLRVLKQQQTVSWDKVVEAVLPKASSSEGFMEIASF